MGEKYPFYQTMLVKRVLATSGPDEWSQHPPTTSMHQDSRVSTYLLEFEPVRAAPKSWLKYTPKRWSKYLTYRGLTANWQ